VDVIVVLVFVSLVLVGFAVLLFAYSVRQADHEHADRLSLLPIEDERTVACDETPQR
jgi:hypothetical protein